MTPSRTFFPGLREDEMSRRSDGFRAHARVAETSASRADDPEVKHRFLDIARSWHALAEMADRGEAVDCPASAEKPRDP
jgi:hypothetical protein